MKGEDEGATSTDVQVPTGDAAAVDDAPGETPEATVKETQDPGGFRSGFNSSLSYASGEGANEEAAARQIGQSINRLPQGDSDVDTNPGPPPPIPLQGESDPNRVGTKLTDGMGEADTLGLTRVKRYSRVQAPSWFSPLKCTKPTRSMALKHRSLVNPPISRSSKSSKTWALALMSSLGSTATTEPSFRAT